MVLEIINAVAIVIASEITEVVEKNTSTDEIKMVLEIINTVVIVVVAIVGFKAWKKEFLSKRKIELAEEVLALFYEAKDAICAIRHPVGYMDEGKTRKPQDNETPTQKKARDDAYVVYERYQKRQEIFNKLHSKRYQFMARFGSDKVENFDKLKEIIGEIFIATDNLVDIWSRGREDEKSLERQRQNESISRGTENDKIGKRLKNIILNVEKICEPIIRG